MRNLRREQPREPGRSLLLFGSRGVPATGLPPAWSPRPEPGRRVKTIAPGIHRVPETGAVCLKELERLGVAFKRPRPRRGIATPVILTGPVNGLKLTPLWSGKPALMDCRFAVTLQRLAPVFRKNGFDELLYSGFYCYRNVAGTRQLSRHANGLAVDVHALKGPGGLRASVLRDWVSAAGRPGDCVAGVKDRKGRMLRQLVCDLEASGLLYLVLTPDSDRAHRNHFHLSGLRPGERSRRWRWAGRRAR